MKPYDIKVTGFIEIGAESSQDALEQFDELLQAQLPIADLRWKTAEIDGKGAEEALQIIQDLANENHNLKLEIKEHNQQVEQMQAEIDQLRLQVYFQGNAVLNQLLFKIDTEFKPEDRNRHRVQNALLRKIVGHVQEVNREIDEDATKAFRAYIDHCRADELDKLKFNLELMADNANENGYHTEASAFHDICDTILERLNLLRDEE